MTRQFNIDSAYSTALEFASSHYENFPVVSFFAKRRLKKHIAIIYWFARTADDIADEGDKTAEERTHELNDFESDYNAALTGEFNNEYFFALASTIRELNLDPILFNDLISAFRQDISKSEYSDFTELTDYCRRSANPVGRLILQLYGYRDEKLYVLSDHICTALQLANFYQDVSVDINKNRLYIPFNELQNYDVQKSDIFSKKVTPGFRELMKHQVERCGHLFYDGRELIDHLHGILRYQIKMTIFGGMKILSLIEAQQYDVLSKRPELTKADFLGIFLKSLL